MKRTVQNLLIATTSLVISLGICEIAARVLIPKQMQVQVTADPFVVKNQAQRNVEGGPNGTIDTVIDWSGNGKHGVRLFPNVTANIKSHTLSKQDVQIRVNSYGLRGPEVGPKQPGEYRVLLIGDSIIFCDYVNEEQSITHLLEQKLKADGVGNVTVLNAGLPGANTAEQYAHYQELASLVQPDLVLLAMYLNDSQEPQKFYAKTLRFPFNKSRFLAWFVQRFQLISPEALFSSVHLPGVAQDWREKFKAGRNLQSGNYLGSRDGFDFEIYNAHKDFGLAWNPTSWVQLSRISTAFSEIVRQNGSKFAAFLFPIAMQVYCEEPVLSTYPQEQFASIFTKLNVPHYDLLPTLRSIAPQVSKLDMYYDHCHYRTKGNEIVADALASWLEKDSLVPRVSGH